MKPTISTLLLLMLVAPACADQKAADACAQNLPKNSGAIYAQAQAQGGDLRDAVKSVARAMVMAGTLSRAEARPAAEAAGQCLKLLKQ